ncbi:sigma-70 family RNA polymerase sigma factor [Planctomycetota bacterium]
MKDLRAEFMELAMPLMESMYRTALRLLDNEKSAEDLVQDTYLKAFKNFHQYTRGTNFKAWIFTILMNSFRNLYRKGLSEPKTIDIDTVSPFFSIEEAGKEMPAPDDNGDVDFDSLVSDEVKAGLSSLPADYREVVLLHMVEGFRLHEIAGILEVPVGTVMSRLYRGRKMLKLRLAEYAKSMGYIKREEGHELPGS